MKQFSVYVPLKIFVHKYGGFGYSSLVDGNPLS